ncbi:MAG: GWxTD domain-containing protein [Ignavibacteriales bacterium]|nr:GWxTD domain-containing protein [Ignavibacteriales bacterium]
MRITRGLFIILGLFGMAMSLVTTGHAQTEMRRGLVEAGPAFYADAIAYASDQPQKSRLDVYVQVPHEEIRFVKEGDQYIGRYEITLSLFSPSKTLTHEQTWTVDVPVAEFSQTTQSKLHSLTHRTVDVEPGNYQMTIQLRDQESRKSSQLKKSLLITDFTKDSLSLSDIMLVNRLSTDGEKRTIVPNIPGSVSNLAEGFFVFFEAYTRHAFDSLVFESKIYDSRKNEVASYTQSEATVGTKTQIFLKLDSTGLRMGTYYLSVVAAGKVGSGTGQVTVKSSTSRTFTVRSADLPVAIIDLQKAIDQLIYIAREAELDYVRSATTEEDKRKRFLEFWSKRDPDPQTQRNELMEEYYGRVQYANQSFTHYLEGWRTDMGMVFIRFGSPDNIERHPFDVDNKPYEIWYYYQLNRQFIFVDETGFGDYRLRYPTTDLWGRMR